MKPFVNRSIGVRRLLAIGPLAVTCASCAAIGQPYVPIPRTGEPDLRWPPLPVDGYVTRDGTRHELAGGFMIESGDSLIFLRPGEERRSALLSLPSPAIRRSFHRDSVASIVVRLERQGQEGAGSAVAAAALGAALAVALVSVTILYGWPLWYGW